MFSDIFKIKMDYNTANGIYTFTGPLGKAIPNMASIGRNNLDLVFKKRTYTTVSFHEVFIYEVISILNYLIKYGRYGGNAKSAQTIKTLLLEHIEKNKNYDVEYDLDVNEITKIFKFTPKDYQLEAFTNYGKYKNETGYRGLLLDASAGTGKALANYEQVKAEQGWKRIGDVQVGDQIVGRDGKYTKVLGVYPQGSRKLYTISFLDGRDIKCDLDHLWTVYSHIDTKYTRKGQYYTLDTQQIKKILSSTDIDNQIDGTPILSIPLYKPVKNSGTECFIITPKELANILTDPDTLYISRTIKKHFKISSTYNEEYWINILSDLGLYKNGCIYKAIPDIYKKASFKYRKQLIDYILKKTSSITRRGKTYYTIDNEQSNLIKDIQEIVWSLGGLCKVNRRSKSSVIYIKYREEFIANQEHPLLPIVSIKSKGMREATCIKVDNKEKLFITTNYIVTHNTFLSTAIAELLHSKHVLVICPLPTLKDAWVDGVDKMFKKPVDGVWTSRSTKEYEDEKYIIVHYEWLENIYKILSKISGEDLTIIIDESHNFSSTKSKRTGLLLDIVDRSLSKNILLLSGTPIKGYTNEIINIVKIVDGRLDDRLYKRMFGLYSNPNKFFKEILPEKYQNLSFKIEKKAIGLDPVIKTYLPITIKNSKEYTLDYIRTKMREYIEKRLKEIEANYSMYEETFNSVIEIAREQNFRSSTKKDVDGYLNLIATIKNSYKKRSLMFIPHILKEANLIEAEIKSILPNELKSKWVECKTIIKYPLLKVQGECLGRVLLPARIQCHVDISDQLPYEDLLNSTVKDTIIFSSYIKTSESAARRVKELGYKPALVYGEFVKNLNKEVEYFTTKKAINPLITTYKALSTGVHMTNANVIIAIDVPYRMYIFEQAISRAWRLGQDMQVHVYIPTLDTGTEPNINERNFDIIKFFNEEVEKITGFKTTLDVSETTDVNTESLTQMFKFDVVDKGFDNTGYISKVLSW